MCSQQPVKAEIRGYALCTLERDAVVLAVCSLEEVADEHNEKKMILVPKPVPGAGGAYCWSEPMQYCQSILTPDTHKIPMQMSQ